MNINVAEQAMANHEFVVYYQPKINMGNGCLAGMEALVRWQKEDGSIISPDEFIPFFEANSLISRLDEYVVCQVLKDMEQWRHQGQTLAPVSINLSAWDLLNEKLMERIANEVKKTSIEPQLIEFELTETICSGQFETICRALENLKADGFLISLDDFGSGYSSLNVLSRIPADTIKLDKEFLSQCGEQSKGRILLGHIITMLTQMGFNVLCEGVESQEQVEYLLKAGCNIGQGYYFSRPIAKQNFEKKYLMAA